MTTKSTTTPAVADTTSKNANDKPKVRTLKIYDKMLERTGMRAGHTVLPEIRLMGRWLEQCGFHPGQHVDIIQEHHKLTITHSWTEKNIDEEEGE